MGKIIALGAAALLCFGCTATGEPVPTRDRLIAFATALGDATIRVYATEAINKKAPHLLPLLDVAPQDGVLSLAEITSYPWDDPAALAIAIVVVQQLVREHGK